MNKPNSERPCSVASGLLWSYFPGHVATEVLPCRTAWRFCTRALEAPNWQCSRWATFIEPRQTIDYFIPCYVLPCCLGSGSVAPDSGEKLLCCCVINDSDVSKLTSYGYFGGGVNIVLFLRPPKQSCTAATMHDVGTSCCQSNGNMLS
jgi:hypothetical protein